MDKKRVAAYTLGCKVSLYDSQSILSIFEKNGYELVDFDSTADIYIILTCTVTNFGDKKSRQIIRRAKKQNPRAIVVACGCYSQVSPEKVMAIEGVNIVVGASNRDNIVEIVENYVEGVENHVKNIFFQREYEDLPVETRGNRTRAYLKIQDGCDKFCTYCIIPYARGPVRSRSAHSILREAEKLSQSGCKEIVLTGIHVASYGKDLGNGDLAEILEIVHQVPGIERIRLSSVEPTVITKDFITRIKNMPKICPHYHLSLQSGCDKILMAMNRSYTTAQYEQAVALIRQSFPKAAITTDVIVGFPGETEEDFLETISFAKKIELAKIHVFPYSKKEGTQAATFKNQVPNKIKQQRAHTIGQVGDNLRTRYLSRFIGETLKVLYEEEKENGILLGYSENYLQVLVSRGNSRVNDIAAVSISKIEDFLAIGEEI